MQSMRLGICVILCCAAIACGLPALSDSTAAFHNTTPVSELDRLVITATRTERRLSDVPVSVSVIGRQEIESQPIRNVDDLLLSEPGVSVKRIVGMGEGFPADIIIRGVPGAYAANRLLVLVDGIATNVASAPFLILNLVPMEAVAQVELVRGPFSSLYGANAFSGVLSVMTRQNKDSRFAASAYCDFWPGAYSDAGLWSSGTIGKAGYMVTGSFRWVDDVLASDSSNYGYRDQRLLGRLSYWMSERTQLSVHGRYFSGEQQFGYSKDGTETPLSNAVHTWLGGAGLVSQLHDRLDVRINAYGRKLSAEYLNTAFDGSDRVPSAWHPYTYDGRVELQATARPGSHHSVTAGADYLYNAATFTETVHRQSGEPLFDGAYSLIHNFGVFIQDEISLGGRLNAVPGLRVDYHSDVGAVLSPKIAGSYRMLQNMRGRLSFGRAFRAPSMVELHMPEQTVAANTTMMPSPELKPEFINALDGGLELQLGPLAAMANGFGNWMQDLITPALVSGFSSGSSESYVFHRNVSQAWSAGFELALTSRWRSHVQLRASYTFTDSWDTSLLQPLEYVPRNTGNLGAQFNIPFGVFALSGSVSETAVGQRMYMEFEDADPDYFRVIGRVEDELQVLPPQRALPAYWRTDASLRITYRERLYLAVAATNLTDAVYQESGNLKAPGRIIAIKVGASI